MHLPTRSELSRQLDGLDDRERRRLVASLAHRRRDDPGLDALLDELEQGDVYERLLAVRAAHVAGREERVLRALRADSALVAAAAGAAGASAGAAALEALLPELAPAVRRRLLGHVVRRRRRDVAEHLLPVVLRRFGAREAARLLPLTSASTVRQMLPEVAPAVRSWRRLAAVHPDAVLGHARGRRLTEPPGSAAPWEETAAALPVLAAQRPKELFDAALELLAEGELPRPLEQRLGTLARHTPEGVALLVLHPAYRARLLGQGLPRSLRPQLRRLPASAHRELARVLLEEPAHLAEMLSALPSARRTELFFHATEGIDTARIVWPLRLLGVLPGHLRDGEARRMLKLREVREDPERRLEITAYRDVDAARPVLEEAAKSPRAERRGRALALLVECSGRARRGLDATLELVRRFRNDQDGVRRSAVAALAALRPSLFAPEHAGALADVAGAVIEARDTSPATRARLVSLAHRLLEAGGAEPGGPLFQLGLEVLLRLDRLQLPPALPAGVEHEAWRAFAPRIRSANSDERGERVIDLARSLGRRAWPLAELQEWLEKMATASDSGDHFARWTSRRAAELWLADPVRRDERVRRLLDRDPSAIAVPTVFRHLHLRRQSWLDPFLAGGHGGPRLRGPKGGFHRWLPRQQRVLRDFLKAVAGDESRPLAERTQALSRLARLPIAEIADVEPFAGANDVPVAEAALGALARTDRAGAVLPVLVEYLDGDRARVAACALRCCLRHAPPDRAREILDELLDRERLKVTVRKEAVRSLGELRGAGALELLARAWRRHGKGHRDVRIACGHAARRRFDSEAAREILEALAGDADAVVVRSLFDPAPALTPSQRPRYAELLLRAAAHPDETVRRDAFRVLALAPQGAEERIANAAAEALLDLDSGVAWRGAVDALIATVRRGKADTGLVALIHALRTVRVASDHDAGPERDLPARRRLASLCCRLAALPEAERRHLDGPLQEVANELFDDVTWWPTAVRLQLLVVDWSHPRTAIVLGELAAEADQEPHFRPHLVTEVDRALRRDRGRWKLAEAAELLAELDAAAEVTARHLELAVVRLAASRAGWIEPWVGRLRRLRRHPNPGVRHAALEVAIREEGELPAAIQGLALLREAC